MMKKFAKNFIGLLVCASAIFLFCGRGLAFGYADGFSVEGGEGGTIRLRVLRPFAREYVLYSGDVEPKFRGESVPIRVPVRKFVSASTTLIPYWEELGVKDRLAGQGSKGYVFDANAISADDMGPGYSMNIEKILALAPDAVFLYASSQSEAALAVRLEALGLNVVVVGEYLETQPLGRVEWLDFFAPFFGPEAQEKAKKYIRETTSKYEALRSTTECEVSDRPDVIMNASWGGMWHVPGGGSLFASFVRDAGGAYDLEKSDGTDGVPLGIETIFARAGGAKFWLNPSAWQSLADGLREDSRYALFRAFKEGRVYNNTRRMNAAGGNDFHEGGVLKPDVILADIISILHPEILPNHELVYYKKLH